MVRSRGSARTDDGSAPVSLSETAVNGAEEAASAKMTRTRVTESPRENAGTEGKERKRRKKEKPWLDTHEEICRWRYLGTLQPMERERTKLKRRRAGDDGKARTRHVGI